MVRATYTAIIHLRDGALPPQRSLRDARGVWDVRFEPDGSMLTVHFDNHQTSLADLVRTIEDAGSSVAGVSQRPTFRGPSAALL